MSEAENHPPASLCHALRISNHQEGYKLEQASPQNILSFHDAQDAKSLWDAIKARFRGNKESKKMQKNLLKQQFETFVVGAKEELDSAYDRFQNIISMLELYDAKRDNLDLDELDFDDLYKQTEGVWSYELEGWIQVQIHKANRANGSKGKENCGGVGAFEDSNSKALVQKIARPLWGSWTDGLEFLTGAKVYNLRIKIKAVNAQLLLL
ncbi:hypothetical protein Tco_1245439 [Tanacetum coccineum]